MHLHVNLKCANVQKLLRNLRVAVKEVGGNSEWGKTAMSRRKRPEGVVLGATYLGEWRKYKKLTLEQVGKKIGLDKSALGRIENGHTPYDQIHLQQLSEVYGVSILDLLYTDPKRQVDINAPWAVHLTQQEKRSRIARVPRATADVMNLVKQLSPEDIETAKMILEAMRAKGNK